MTVRQLAAVAALAFAGSVVVEVGALRGGAPDAGSVERLLAWYAAAAVLFAVGGWAVRSLPLRASLSATLAGGALLQVVAVGYSPTTTDDFWRYLWDGKVQAAGIDPYRYVPLDPALAHLRDDELFPPDPRTPEQAAEATAFGRTDVCTTRGVSHDCTWINRPHVRTIYPPVAEGGFLLLHVASPDEHRVRTLQVTLGALAVAVTAALAWARQRAGRDPRAAVWWAWCPVVWLEGANNAHIDVLGVLLLVGALGLLAGRRLVAGGALFGAAVAVKLVPVLLVPALLVRRGHVVLAAAAAVFLAGYVPHVAAVGTNVLGYLPGYLEEEGYSGAQRFGAVRLLVPDAAAPAVAVAVGVAVAVWVWRRAQEHPSAADALTLAGVAFVLVGPSQPWYGLLIVALVALADRPEWLAIAAAAYPVYQAGNLGVDNTAMQQWCYLTAAAAAAVGGAVRRRRGSAPAERPSSALPRERASRPARA
ncbi:glycosyltransferase 87 family protein [Sporichthya polymorpha]|uniref:glycosyltransferase 87 family protein n=1 Tax=Sporichthya polymorpha TaxID=35751 RepID=UPI0003705284|nr:glycosyltransferase 87 family protein [Sporichthya polymorpha]